MLRLWAALSVLICMAAVVSAQNGRFYYRNFRDRSFLTLSGDAKRDGECIRLVYAPCLSSSLPRI